MSYGILNAACKSRLKISSQGSSWCGKYVLENEKIDNLIQEMQLKIHYYYDIIVEWISYNQLNNIKKLEKDEFSTIYSSIWKDGLLKYDRNKDEYSRDQDIKVNLNCLHNSQNVTNEFLNEIETYFDDDYLYGISQNPDTKDYILVLQNVYCNKCSKRFTDEHNLWYNLIREMQLEINYYHSIIIEWILYDQFKDIKKCLHDSQNISNEFLIEILKDIF
ncbi:kinase-like domain-containing protein [Rhizophagus clarus]|uniref:Kinase-like domain-containing protein n=1 Tax=Rhizophagus clarus TaxID=94130 RepID=A0A8H3LWL5_9GLOM|nr:kinase-like domain-containing protein [Rhizophagus clarus]